MSSIPSLFDDEPGLALPRASLVRRAPQFGASKKGKSVTSLLKQVESLRANVCAREAPARRRADLPCRAGEAAGGAGHRSSHRGRSGARALPGRPAVFEGGHPCVVRHSPGADRRDTRARAHASAGYRSALRAPARGRARPGDAGGHRVGAGRDRGSVRGVRPRHGGAGVPSRHDRGGDGRVRRADGRADAAAGTRAPRPGRPGSAGPSASCARKSAPRAATRLGRSASAPSTSAS